MKSNKFFEGLCVVAVFLALLLCLFATASEGLAGAFRSRVGSCDYVERVVIVASKFQGERARVFVGSDPVYLIYDEAGLVYTTDNPVLFGGIYVGGVYTVTAVDCGIGSVSLLGMRRK